MEALRVECVNKTFDGVKAVDRVSLSIRKATITAIIGPNGAGKTTLFNLICGFIRQDSGTVFYKSQRIDNLSPSHRALLGIGRLWQDLRLFRNMTLLDNLLVATKSQPGEKILKDLFSYRKLSKIEKENIESAEAVLNSLKLYHKRHNLAQNVSYGEQKLLGLGRLLMNGAELLLLDEPAAGINPIMIDEVLSLIKGLANKEKTVLMIEHNIPKAIEISDWVYVMDEGRIEISGTPSNVFSNPHLRAIYWGV